MKVTFNINMSQGCELGPTGRKVIAQGDGCTIEACGCGVMHVTLGVVTLRVHPSAVVSMYETLGEALAIVSRPATTELYS